MPLEPGQPLAHYRIDRKIGEGGMGEVWSATDSRLNRVAAIKALPEALAADPERLARFRREAQLLAALSHPNIAAIYGLEQVDGAMYLALEFVDGDDLSVRIDGRALGHDEVVEIALQIAAALEAAHDKGIVHRDLKPANIKLAADGTVKVLDFGLAKALSDDPEASLASLDASSSPTMTRPLGTQAGMILGTAGYMSPEQARGKAVDRRADIWAFGVIVFEMLTGERLFSGETATDVIAQVVTREPDWERLPADTPPALRRLLRRCLRKDPRRRLRDIGDAALELREAEEGEATAGGDTPATPSNPRRAWWIGAAGLALGLTLASAIAIGLRPPVTERPLTWSTLRAPAGVRYEFKSLLELSPDGRRVAFVAVPEGGDDPVLWVRQLGEDEARPLPGTEDAYLPFWSPDSRSIGFFSRGKLRRIGIDGGVATALVDVGAAPRGGAWGRDGTIVFAPEWNEPMFRIAETGGTPVAITALSEERLELSHRWPHLLPDGKHFLYYAVSTYPQLNPLNPSEVDRSGLYLGSFDGAEPRLVQTARSRAVYTDGSLMYVDEGILTLRSFDLVSLSFSGEPVALVEGVTQSADALWGAALFSVSDEGTLMFVRGAPERRELTRLQWFDRAGHELDTVGDVAPYNTVRISHDGNRVLTSFGDPADVWIHDLGRGTATRFTFDSGNDDAALWSPDDGDVLFLSSRVIPGRSFRANGLFRRSASGQGEAEPVPIDDSLAAVTPTHWSPDGTRAVLTSRQPGTGDDIVFYRFETGTVESYLATEYDEGGACFSPDGRRLAYVSNESGSSEIYVAPYPATGGKWQVSNGGGQLPVWRADGEELFYLGPDHLMAVAVETDGAFRSSTPVRLFELPQMLDVTWTFQTFDAAPDGQRFLFMVEAEDESIEAGTVTLVQGWRGMLSP